MFLKHQFLGYLIFRKTWKNPFLILQVFEIKRDEILIGWRLLAHPESLLTTALISQKPSSGQLWMTLLDILIGSQHMPKQQTHICANVYALYTSMIYTSVYIYTQMNIRYVDRLMYVYM